jgi:crotonobetainyl-CoA:carnitine CoA-transferase CaiB-like acyl-CoA transferase
MSVTLDVRRREAMELFNGLVRVSDIVLENNSPDVMEDLGLSYRELKKIRPDLIMIRMPAFGLEGPYRSYRAWGAHVEGVIGHTWVRGYKDVDHSLKDDVYSSDAVAGITAAFSAMAALRHRDLTGRGQLIELALSEVLPPFLAEAILDHTMNGREQSSLGNGHFSEAPHGCYWCEGDDHWVTIAVSSDKEWEGLLRAMGRPDWAQDRRFGNVLGRWRNQEKVDRHIQEWTRGMKARDVMFLLQEEGVPSMMVMDEAEVYGDPQFSALGFFKDITHPEAGTHRYPGFMGQLGPPSDAARRPAPCLGQHNPYVYRELLGLSDREYEGLRASGHIAGGPGPMEDF